MDDDTNFKTIFSAHVKMKIKPTTKTCQMFGSSVANNLCQKELLPIYLFKVNIRNSGSMLKICSKLTKMPERLHWHHPGVFIVKFE